MRSATLLAPPSPPGAPHLGGVYTWSIVDAIRRTRRYFGQDTCVPQSWNMASRRLEANLGGNPAAYADYCSAAILDATNEFSRFGITTSHIVLRDDDPAIREHVQAIIKDMAETGRIRHLATQELWCLSCQLALPPTATTAACFVCGKNLVLRTTEDWHLIVSAEDVFHRARTIQWSPDYGLRRLFSLTEIHPLVRVNHARRTLGIPSPLQNGTIIDPRLVGALGPSILHRLGVSGAIIAVAGFDIQRKWLLTLLAANRSETLPKAVVHHGLLLDSAGRKLSRYSGASLADVPSHVGPCLIRASLLAAPLGKDLRADQLSIADVSRLREKVLNCLRFLSLQQPSRSGIDLDLETEPLLAEVEGHLSSYDLARAYASFRRAIVHGLSSGLIPKVRIGGLLPGTSVVKRIASLHQVFFGDDPRISQFLEPPSDQPPALRAV